MLSQVEKGRKRRQQDQVISAGERSGATKAEQQAAHLALRLRREEDAQVGALRVAYGTHRTCVSSSRNALASASSSRNVLIATAAGKHEAAPPR